MIASRYTDCAILTPVPIGHMLIHGLVHYANIMLDIVNFAGYTGYT
jgi:hypothetical protein